MDLQIINPLEIPEWDDMIAQHPDATIFHTSSWARVLSESYGYRPLYFTKIESGELKALVPMMEVKSFITGKRGVSLPFTDYCPPLLTEGYDLEAIFPQLVRFGEKSGWKYVELRGTHGDILNAVPSTTYLTHTLPLSEDADRIRSGFRNSTVRNIKRAVKEGVEVTMDATLPGMKEFYRLNCMTRKEHGLPPQPFYFFRNLHRHIISRGSGTVFLGSYQGKTVAAVVCLQFGKKAVYKYGASDRRFLATRANNLVMWKAIKHYGSTGFETFCFGRTEPENSGLSQFKAGWGTEEGNISYLRFDLHRKDFIRQVPGTRNWHNQVFSKMPIPTLNMVGKLLYRHMG
ncbi:MAG TPA: GNAT family N-acetyltransferase [Proteobacteria bacterium]|nr:GNAT family N-acetyltransferase [Pseudomonadota bacterium]